MTNPTKRNVKIEQVSPYQWRIPRTGGMRVDGVIYADEALMRTIRDDPCVEQVANVAHLPGIVKASIAMPDIHWGYGFPIGGVAAFDEAEGVIVPGGIGFDINCGVRLLRTDLTTSEVGGKLQSLVSALFENVPAGVGSKRRDLRLTEKEGVALSESGARWAVEQGYGKAEDLIFIEEGGALAGGDFSAVTKRAFERGKSQIGTLGSGNHFCEVQVVSEIYDEKIAEALRLYETQLTVMIHTGSRGFGYQICDDWLERMLQASRKYGISLPDRQLCCAPLGTPEAQEYMAAMAAAANFAFANRQIITHFVRESFRRVFGKEAGRGIEVVYDVCHNIAKMETHRIGAREQRLCVHRKGATRAFPPGHEGIPQPYRAIGQPVIVPGDMGRYSFVLVGTEQAFGDTFGSSCHGAGRMMSRTKAKKSAKGRAIEAEMAERGIVVRAVGRGTLAEEIPEAYKDVADVVDVVHGAGIGRKVARLRPVGVVKG
ncbi:MAG: RtcB family protein [Deltaproteobacteria bacterium]|nr:MAG: RtcB family protein [Deltaproteobacteria bacterium]